MPRFYRRHLLIRGRNRSYPYTSISRGRDPVVPKTGLDRAQHAKSIRRQFNRAVRAFRNERNPDFVYLDAFKARVSKAMREEDYLPEGGEHWLLGENTRNKGSLHKDIWTETAIDLSGKNKIAIYPVGGWWRYRKQLKRYEYSVRYSLIVTIETPDIDVDIYTPVANIIDISI